MATPKALLTHFLYANFVMLCIFNYATAEGLEAGFYVNSCPQAEEIATQMIDDILTNQSVALAGPLLRLSFHDCMVSGCDGSILLNSTPTNKAEKDAFQNSNLLEGYEIIDKVKAQLEQECPGVVSCADIVALVARDAVVKAGGQWWEVETGRRDSLVSLMANVSGNLPPPNWNIDLLKGLFQQKGLNVTDLAVLSGAHTIGQAHCGLFESRLYNFTGKGNDTDFDHSMDPQYVATLRKECKGNGSDATVTQDPETSYKFDQNYYNLVQKKRGLFQTDAALLNDPETKAYVERVLKDGNRTSFFKDFGDSMVKMSRIGVLTGNAGEVRKVCSKIN